MIGLIGPTSPKISFMLLPKIYTVGSLFSSLRFLFRYFVLRNKSQLGQVSGSMAVSRISILVLCLFKKIFKIFIEGKNFIRGVSIYEKANFIFFKGTNKIQKKPKLGNSFFKKCLLNIEIEKHSKIDLTI